MKFLNIKENGIYSSHWASNDNEKQEKKKGKENAFSVGSCF